MTGTKMRLYRSQLRVIFVPEEKILKNYFVLLRDNTLGLDYRYLFLFQRLSYIPPRALLLVNKLFQCQPLQA